MTSCLVPTGALSPDDGSILDLWSRQRELGKKPAFTLLAIYLNSIIDVGVDLTTPSYYVLRFKEKDCQIILLDVMLLSLGLFLL